MIPKLNVFISFLNYIGGVNILCDLKSIQELQLLGLI
jgi:hypothetical protein